MTVAPVRNVGVYSGAVASVVASVGVTLATDTLFGIFCLPANANVVSVVDNTGNRWIQNSYSTSTAGNVEQWVARAIQGGAASITAIFSAASVGCNFSEFSGAYASSPLDTWSQNSSSGASITPQSVSPRMNGDLVFVVANGGASVSAPTGGYTRLTVPGGTDFSAGYQILSGSVVTATHFNQAAASPYATIQSAFMPGQAGVNALLQFPETMVQICESGNYQAPLQGTAIWTDISSDVKSFDVSGYGRSHVLDRVQSTQVSVVVNNRSGNYNSWNSLSFLWPNGLDPMSPLKITAATAGSVSPVAFAYIQSITPNITDVLNVDATIDCYDIFQMLNLGYLSNDNYAQQVIADGGTNLQAYYRFGDPVNSYSAIDSSGNGNTGSLIAGEGGVPTYGNAGPFLYDPSTSLDVTAGTNVLNGGVELVDNTTQPPTVSDPLTGATSWTFECWGKWTSNTEAVPGAVTAFIASQFSGNNQYLQISDIGPSTVIPAIGSTIAGPGIAANTVVTALGNTAGTEFVTLSNNWTGAGGTSLTFTSTIGGTGSTLFSAASVPGVGADAVDIRVGATTAASITSFNRVNAGTYNPLNGSYTAPVTAAGNVNTLDGNWHHIVVPYSASVASIYVDGSFSASAGTGAGWSNPKTITIGTDAGPINGWVGELSDVALYSTTLTAAQIANHYSIGLWFQVQEYGASVGGVGASRLAKLLAVERLNPSQILNVPYPFRTLLYSETNTLTTTSGLNYIQTMTETEGPGIIFQGPNGMINAYSRQYAWLSPTTTTSQAVFADNTAASVTGYYDGPSLQIVQDDLDEWTDIQVQSGRSGDIGLSSIEAQIFQTGSSGATLQEWGPVQSPTMAAAASVWGSRTLQGLTSLQMEYDSDALALAQLYASSFNTPIRRVTSMTLNSQGGGGVNIPQQLQRGIYDRITIQYQGQTPGPAFKADSVIEQIQHTVDMSQPTWSTQFATSPYEVLLTPFIFGNAAQSQLAGAASVTGSGTSWIHHPAGTHYLSGTVVWTVASGATTTTPYNAIASQVQAALAALVPSTTCSGGPLNSANVVVTFGSSQASFSAFWTPSQVLTL